MNDKMFSKMLLHKIFYFHTYYSTVKSPLNSSMWKANFNNMWHSFPILFKSVQRPD